MSNIVVVGSQWGDEGKGKIVDLLTEKFDVVARYQGGHNAGHTVISDGRKYVLHLIPAGIVRPDKICVIGNGVVIDPFALVAEIETLAGVGISVEGRLFISNRAHVIMPYHRAIEEADEELRATRRIGTTSRGIGPCYEDKMARRGIRIGDLLRPESLGDKIDQNTRYKNRLLKSVYKRRQLDAAAVLDSYLRVAEKIKPLVTDTAELLNALIAGGKSVLFEGAQGTLLDVDHGTYPFVTASNASAGGAAAGTGIGPTLIHGVLGVAKAYTTRVGQGPFPTELDGELGDYMRERGAEYGASTGRPRRCGWFDAVVVRYARLINNIDTIVLTKLDVLDELPEIKVCVGYSYKGSPVRHFPMDIDVLAECRPIYKTVKGWRSRSSGIRDFDALPQAAKDYLKLISDFVETEISIVSTGPDRRQTIMIERDSRLQRLLPFE